MRCRDAPNAAPKPFFVVKIAYQSNIFMIYQFYPLDEAGCFHRDPEKAT
jgi:hypothetical protein